MKKLLLFVTLSFLPLLFSGCSNLINLYYDVGLTEVEQPDKTIVNMKNISTPITLSSKPGIGSLTFEDSNIKIDWNPTLADFNFRLKNKTSSTIKLIWDGVVYVDTANITHRVMHGGTKFIKSDETSVPSVIIRGGILDDVIYPADMAYYEEGGKYSTGGWQQPDLFKGFMSPQKAAATKSILLNKSIKILLPFIINDKNHEYIFNFKIIGINTAEELKKQMEPVKEVSNGSTATTPKKDSDIERMEKEVK